MNTCILYLVPTVTPALSPSVMFSEEAEAREERRAALEKEREELALKNEETRKRVTKYDRLKKRTQKKVWQTNAAR